MLNYNQISDARKKAEEFLYQVVEETEQAFKAEEEYLVKPDIDSIVPLRFEAFSYLAYRYKKLLPDYSKLIRAIWLQWIDHDVFWPQAQEKIYSDEWGEPAIGYDTGISQILNDISMFRAFEEFEIKGLESYFDESRFYEYFIYGPLLSKYGKCLLSPRWLPLWALPRIPKISSFLERLKKMVISHIESDLDGYALRKTLSGHYDEGNHLAKSSDSIIPFPVF